jgi:hypothetical protein
MTSKLRLIAIIAIALLLAYSTATAQSSTSLSRACPGPTPSPSRTKVDVEKDGDINLVPCAGHSVLVNGVVIASGSTTLPSQTGNSGKFLTTNGTAASWHAMVKSDVGLGNVDNTSDLNKPISTATQTALDLKAPIASPTFTGTVSGITASMVGLGNVDNTSDVNKPVSTAQAAAIALKVTANGAITGATKTKITYDTKGLVTAGADATTADIADSSNKRYVTDANLTTLASALSVTVANGTSALGTGAISSATCATVVTTAATGTATTDVIWWGFNGDPTAVTGYVPLTAGMLTIIAYPSANNVNFKVCNNTSSSITPGAITLNWRIIR